MHWQFLALHPLKIDRIKTFNPLDFSCTHGPGKTLSLSHKTTRNVWTPVREPLIMSIRHFITLKGICHKLCFCEVHPLVTRIDYLSTHYYRHPQKWLEIKHIIQWSTVATGQMRDAQNHCRIFDELIRALIMIHCKKYIAYEHEFYITVCCTFYSAKITFNIIFIPARISRCLFKETWQEYYFPQTPQIWFLKSE